MRRNFNKGGMLLVTSAFLLSACGGGGGNDDDDSLTGSPSTPVAEETRAQDSRVFAASDPASASDYEATASGAGFRALSGSVVQTDRWAGVMGGAEYRIEVPQNWNGRLVMYAHGFESDLSKLQLTMPTIRRHLIENGYAWAASSYSKNLYDVRAGIEDTNALANAFVSIAAQRGRALTTPVRTYIIGHSMGGHVAAAAVEEETARTANNKRTYDGAVPMCGALGDTELFDYLAAYQIAAQTLAGYGSHPTNRFQEIADDVQDELFTSFSTIPKAKGTQLANAVKDLTGGERPVFDLGFANTAVQDVVWRSFGDDGTIIGILNKNNLDTNRFVYQLDSDPAQSAEEVSFNNSVQRLTAAPDANRLRTDGLRWIPKVNGEFKVPVVTLHSLGDMYVPFSMEQIYRRRAEANGSANLLVQRAIRAPSHCDFTIREQVEAFEDMIGWAERGTKPAGDDVLTPATVAAPTYGCAFTRNAESSDDDPVTLAARRLISPALASCPSS